MLKLKNSSIISFVVSILTVIFVLFSGVIQTFAATGNVKITGYDSTSGPNDYVKYTQGKYYRIQSPKYITIKGNVTNTSGQAVANEEVTVGWINSKWSVESGNRERTAVGTTDENGNFSITISDLPIAWGAKKYYVGGTYRIYHYYDVCSVYASALGTTKTDTVYHYLRSEYTMP